MVDSRGKRYAFPVAVGILASSPEIYAAGLGCSVDEIAKTWEKAMANPIGPVTVDSGPVHEIIHMDDDLNQEGKGLDMIPSRSWQGCDCC